MRWEWDLLRFLRRELAFSPRRARAAARVTVVTTLAIAGVLALGVPDGEFLLVTLFVLTPADAGASLIKGTQRVAGTLAGGAVALAVLALSLDKPWAFLPLQATVLGAALFFARTTTAPYAFVLGAVTFAMVLPVFPTEPNANIERLLWRTALTGLGAFLATGAQLVLWPDDPEALLLDDLAARARLAAGRLARLLDGSGAAASPGDTADALAGSAVHLDLLKNAEARSRAVREEHTQQVALITNAALLSTGSWRLERLVASHPLRPATAARIARAAAACASVADALAARRPFVPPAAAPAAPPPDTEIDVAVDTIERALARLPRATAFLAGPDPGQAPLDAPVFADPLLTPACTLANVDAVRFGCKVAVAVATCSIVIAALQWPGLSTSIISCVVLAQSFFGAGLRKAVLRIIGAVAGSLIALFVIVALMPNLETLASYLVVSAACFGGAAWVTAGSSRIGYVGLQMAIVLALTVVQPEAPTTDLAPAADRILGVLLGIAVMATVDGCLWPVFGRAQLRATLAAGMRQIAVRLRLIGIPGRPGAANATLAVHRTLADALAIQDDMALEPGGAGIDAPPADLPLHAIGGSARLLLDVLALDRDRTAPPSRDEAAALVRIAGAIDGLADELAAGAPAPEPFRLNGLPALDGRYALVLDALAALASDVRALAGPGWITPARAPRRSQMPAPQPS